MITLKDWSSYLVEDLRRTLDAGVARDLAAPPNGDRWLGRWVAAALLVGLTLLLFCGYHGGFARLNGSAAAVPAWMWELATLLGDERVAFALALFACRRRPGVFWTLILAALVATVYSQGLKHLVPALRPPGVLDPSAFNLIGPGHRKSSFPSGHTVTASVFFGVWVYYLRGVGSRWLMVALATAAGLSRVAVGVHWPVDVAAGMAGGAAAAWVGALLARRWHRGGRDPIVHLILVTLACFPAAALLLWDGGYARAAGVQTLLGITALAVTVYQYLALPSWIGLRRGALSGS